MSLNWEEVEAGSLVRQVVWLCWNFYDLDTAIRIGALEAIGREIVPDDLGRLLDVLWLNDGEGDPGWREELDYIGNRPSRGDPRTADFANWGDATAATYASNVVRSVLDRGSLVAQDVTTFTLAADTLEAMLAEELVRDDDNSVFFDEMEEQQLAQAFMVAFQESARAVAANIRRRRR